MFSAGSYWVQDSKGVHEAPESLASVIRGNVQRDTVPLLLALMDGKVSATISDTVEAGRTLPTLEVTLPGSSPLTLIFDPATALLARAKYRLSSPPGDIAVEEIYSDYRDVKGLKVAFSDRRAPRWRARRAPDRCEPSNSTFLSILRSSPSQADRPCA